MKEIAKNREEAIRKIYLMISVAGKVKNIDNILRKVADEYNVLPKDLIKISGNFSLAIGSLDQGNIDQDIKFLREGINLSVRSKEASEKKLKNIIKKSTVMYKRIYKCHPKTETKSSYEYTRDEIIKFKNCFDGDKFQDSETGEIKTIEEICATR